MATMDELLATIVEKAQSLLRRKTNGRLCESAPSKIMKEGESWQLQL